MKVHLEGMGWVGSYLALRLGQEGIEFTWSDTDSPINAWRASTGCIYPSGSEWEMQSYVYWLEHPLHLAFFAFAPFWYSSKAAPHGGRWKAKADTGALRQHQLPTMHVNVVAFVEEQRRVLSALRRESAPAGSRVIRGQQPTHYLWGWSAKARLQWDERLAPAGIRPCIYLRPNKFETLYAYPVPNEQTHYVGSAMIAQRVPHTLSLADKVLRWEDRFELLTRGQAYVTQFTEYRQGWRPYSDVWENARVVTLGPDGTLEICPMRHSGVRLAPAVADAVLRELR